MRAKVLGMGYLLDNWHQRPGLHKQAWAGEVAKSIFGISDMQKGFNSLGEGKIFKGIGQMALGTALGVTTLVPGVGWLAKGGLMGLKGLATAARGTKAVAAARAGKAGATASKLSKSKALSPKEKAFAAGKSQRQAENAGKAVTSGKASAFPENAPGPAGAGKAFNTFMKENVSYGKPLTGSPYRPDNLVRSAWEAGKVATFGGRQAHAWRAGRGGLDGVGPTMFNKMRIGVNEGNLRTKAGQWAARHPHYANFGLTVGVPGVATGVGMARYSPPQQQGFGGFNVSPLIAGSHQSPGWLQERGWGSTSGPSNNWLS